MARWLLPLFAVLALCARSVTAYASAGWVGKTSCCCPDITKCKCHHDKHRANDELDRCSADAKLVAPESAPSTIALPVIVPAARALTAIVVRSVPVLSSVLPDPPTPPPI